VIICFDSSSKNYDDFEKSLGVTSYKIIKPAFYEVDKLFYFFEKLYGYIIPFNVKNYIIDMIDPNPLVFSQSILKLQLNCPDTKMLTNKIVDQILDNTYIEFFTLAQYISTKKFKEFYSELLLKQFTFEGMIILFTSLEGHLVKLIDPTYCAKKNKQTKYDKKIIEDSKFWKEEELLDILGICRDVILRAKLKDKTLFHFFYKQLIHC
jgi:DNA polymerase III delta subunit